MVLQYMFTDLSPDAIKLLLEGSHLLDSLEIQPHFILSESLNFEVPHQ